MNKKIVIIVLSILFSIKSNICYADQYEQTAVASHIADPQEAFAFVEETYKDEIRYRRDNKSGSEFYLWTDEEIDKLTVGKGFYVYNVDGKQQQAIFFYPLYEGETCRWFLKVGYEEGEWKYFVYNDPFHFFIASDINAEALTRMDYAGKESICYSLNNQVYMEVEENKVLLECMNEQDGDVYSKEELEFMNMDFEQKKALYDKGYEELYDVRYCNIGDDDPGKRLVGGGYPEKMNRKTVIVRRVKQKAPCQQQWQGLSYCALAQWQ